MIRFAEWKFAPIHALVALKIRSFDAPGTARATSIFESTSPAGAAAAQPASSRTAARTRSERMVLPSGNGPTAGAFCVDNKDPSRFPVQREAARHRRSRLDRAEPTLQATNWTPGARQSKRAYCASSPRSLRTARKKDDNAALIGAPG